MPIALIILGFGLVIVGVVFAVGGVGKGKAAGTALRGVSVSGPSWLVLVALGASIIVYGSWMFERDGQEDAPLTPAGGEPEPEGQIFPFDFGDDVFLDELWIACESGDGAACDELFQESPVGSLYENFGLTCGDRFQPEPGACVDEDMSVLAE